MNRLVFNDFHIHGASAPQWRQRYLQMSPGAMRSALVQWSSGDAHVFGKWISQRVLQQGCLPAGQVCFALLGAAPTQPTRMQGREFGTGELLVLRGGEDFEFHRPAGAELLSVTFDAAAFSAHLHAARQASAQNALARGGVLRLDAAGLGVLRQAIRARLAGLAGHGSHELTALVGELLCGPAQAPAQRAASLAAARTVRACQQIVLNTHHEEPPGIDALCAHVGVSRRSLQNSFWRVSGTSPLIYLRNLRLNAVRQRLLASPASRLSVTDAALASGFSHLGHFAAAYRQLFGQSPSHTPRPRR